MAEQKEYPIKTRVVHVKNKKTGVVYLEERKMQYDPAVGWNRVIESRRLGQKIGDGEDQVVACRPKRKKAASETKTPEHAEDVKTVVDADVVATRTRIGATDILNFVGAASGLDKAVQQSFRNGGDANKILSVARYLVVSGDAVHNIDTWQYDHDLPYSEGISEDVCYELFEEVGRNETGMQKLFHKLASFGGESQNILAFDSTTISTYSDGLTPVARQGFNKDGDGLDSFKLLTFYSIESRLPVSFEIQAGNIADVSSVVNALKRVRSYSLNQPELVLDNGFFSKLNVGSFCHENVKFTVRATLSDTWIRCLLDPKEGEKTSPRQHLDQFGSACPFDPFTHGYSICKNTPLPWMRQRNYGEKEAGKTEKTNFRIYYHYFKNHVKANNDKNAFTVKIHNLKSRLEEGQAEFSEADQKIIDTYLIVSKGKKIKVKINEEACMEAIEDFGIFVLISNVHKDPWMALKHYRQRNIIETSYRVIKSELDGRRARVWSMDRERGKELCRMVALGYRFYLQDLMNKAKAKAKQLAMNGSTKLECDQYKRVADWLESMTLHQLLAWFDCIERVGVRNKRAQIRWSSESTKRDKLILKLLLAKDEEKQEEEAEALPEEEKVDAKDEAVAEATSVSAE